MIRRRLFVVALAAPFVLGAAKDDRPSVVVQNPEISKGVEAEIGEALGEVFADHLGRSGAFGRIVTYTDVARMLQQESMKQLLGCSDTGEECLAEIGGALGAKYLTLIEVHRIGKTYVVGTRLIDLVTAKVPLRHTQAITALEAALPIVEELARKVAAAAVAMPGSGGDTENGLAMTARAGEAKRGEVAKSQEDAAAKAKREAEERAKALAAESPGMALVAAGSFFFGCNAQVDDECLENEKPGHSVAVDAFKIDLRETTKGEYAECVDAGSCTEPDGDTYGCVWSEWFTDAQPINCVDMTQAEAYCAWRKKRLPTAREWEKAARGPDGRKFPWGNKAGDPPPAQLAPVANGITDVGTFAAGASPYGALDMAGNVAEWTSTSYDGGRFEYRGGGFLSPAKFARTSDRHRAEAKKRAPDVGFRCAL